MNYYFMHTTGYGVYTNEIKLDSVERLQKLIACAPIYEQFFNDEIRLRGIERPTISDYYEIACDDEDFAKLATILQCVIYEAEGITFYADRTYNNQFIVYNSMHPWCMTERDKRMTPEKVVKILKKYLLILSDNPPEVNIIFPWVDIEVHNDNIAKQVEKAIGIETVKVSSITRKIF